MSYFHSTKPSDKQTKGNFSTLVSYLLGLLCYLNDHICKAYVNFGKVLFM